MARNFGYDTLTLQRPELLCRCVFRYGCNLHFSWLRLFQEKNRHGGASSWREASRAREQQRFRAAGLVKPDEVLVQVTGHANSCACC